MGWRFPSSTTSPMGGTDGRVGGFYRHPMTALNLSSIPSGINSIERLCLWAGMALQSTTNGLQVNAVAGEAQVPAAGVTITKTADNVDRAVILLYVPVDISLLNSSTVKAFMAATDLSTAAPHANLLSN